jgi:hypothetical protein
MVGKMWADTAFVEFISLSSSEKYRYKSNRQIYTYVKVMKEKNRDIKSWVVI